MTTRYKILLVDDEVEFRDTLRDVLEIQGYEISTAADGVSALDMDIFLETVEKTLNIAGG